jgi:hypothetical protein
MSDRSRTKQLYIALVLFMYYPVNSFGGWVPYSSALPAGTKCYVEVQSLHPTQFAVGYREIERRTEKLIEKSDKKILEYMKHHAAKIVVGPNGEPYIVDSHHLACIIVRIGKSKTIYAVVEANLGNLPVDSFWNEMVKMKWAYLYDENGRGPLDPKNLPKTIKDLKDDPFRSLAWEVRERGGFKKTDDPFAEFQWADFFRNKISLKGANENMDQLIYDAMELCHTSSASKLPGYSDIDEIPGKMEQLKLHNK